VIGESSYWKEDLLRSGVDLRRRQKQRRWADSSLARVERILMLGFYSIRKLIDARRLSDSTMARPIRISVYPSTGTRVTLLNASQIEKHYKLERESHVERSLLFVCNQVIHSYVFQFELLESGALSAILFASDWHRGSGLYRMDMGQVIETFTRVGKDYPNTMTATYSKEKGDYIVRQEMVEKVSS